MADLVPEGVALRGAIAGYLYFCYLYVYGTDPKFLHPDVNSMRRLLKIW
ncbi:hypothetical protein [Myxacorys almedinensis]|uniref:Uncharacterized protein n=1 Tax=Myxacorys almedinensis A TaxID=2690445 RepID=A0A8J7YWC0_9CYAN|nr:hypothetical protein [Myxacorys almedinensis]NDJ15809.1 hypothetical protein [Myxacorys almedinensis A]